jgi:DNA-binding transcriptional LysR family regulator
MSKPALPVASRALDHLGEMAVFARVVDAASFSGAARRLGLSTSAVSKQISRLEQCLGVRLLNRSTRSLSLTDEGRAVHEHCAHLVAAAEAAELAAGNLLAAPRGTLRVSAPVSFGTQHVAPAIPSFLARYPETRVELVLLDRFVDLAEEGFDIAIRLSSDLPGTMVARHLLDIDFVVCASPAYLAQRGTPRQPADLAGHNCVLYGHGGFGNKWRFAANGAPSEVKVSGNYQVNSSEALHSALLADMGIGLLPRPGIDNDLARGTLRVLLPEWKVIAPYAAASALFAADRQRSPKLRAFIDHLVLHFSRTATAPAEARRASARPRWMGW